MTAKLGVILCIHTRNVGLPMGAVEEDRSGETLQQQEGGIKAQGDGAGGG